MKNIFIFAYMPYFKDVSKLNKEFTDRMVVESGEQDMHFAENWLLLNGLRRIKRVCAREAYLCCAITDMEVLDKSP